MRKTGRVLARGLIAGSLIALAAAATFAVDRAPPPLDVALRPIGGTEGVDRIGVTMRIPAPATKAGSPLLRMPVVMVGTPTAAYTAAAIEARDDQGPLPLAQRDEAPGASGTYRIYTVARATVGDVTVRYAAPPRAVSSETRNGPLFDLRAQAGGLIGTGVYFFALPVAETPFTIKLHWDMAEAPRGTRGVWSYGEGDQTQVGPAQTLAYSFYAMGPVRSAPADGAGDFGFYWLKQPPFDPVALGTRVHRLYAYMSRFFGDPPGSTYRVFARENPYPAGGGTSLPRAFMFGYGASGATTEGGSDMLIAHEMAHNWPQLSGDDHPATAWYSEGTAEFYSVMLSLRAGTIDLARFQAVVNDHAREYYTNPFVNLTNAAAGKLFWSDARAQRVPYGRGFMYLAKVDGQMRAKSGGRRRLDDLVLEVLRRQRAGETVGNEQWVEMVVRELGPGARRDYADMVAGRTVLPPASSFGPCFRLVRAAVRPFDLGFDEMRLGVVKDLRAGSAAASAGLREGDAIVSLTPMATLHRTEGATADIVVRRDGRQVPLRFAPYGAPVEAWRWERVSAVPTARCAL